MKETKELNEFTQAYLVWAVNALVFFAGWILCAAVIYLLQNKENSFDLRAFIAAIGSLAIIGIIFVIKRRIGF